jgi:hypothetical protein
VTSSTSLFTGVFSVVPTRRRRFFWAAWWTAPPSAEPFQPPDAQSGGARTREEARAAAECAAGHSLVETEGHWAGACVRVLRGDPPWPKPRSDEPPPTEAVRATAAPSGGLPAARALLGVAADASADDVRRAFRAAALRTHPDHGGEDAAFIAARRAYEVALAAATGERKARRRRR